MASVEDKQIALLPIQPRYAESIISGQKKVEFRKVKFRRDVSHVVVYASSPIKKIIGYFEVSYIDEDTPEKLWSRYKEVGGIVYEDFKDYYSSSDKGIVIGVGEVCTLSSPLPLSILDQSLTVPQSFSYLSIDALKILSQY
jgi:predicted transcriptional regulator